MTRGSSERARGEFLTVLEEVLKASIEITGAAYGIIQMVTSGGDALEIVAQCGFKQEFLDHFELVSLEDTTPACGRAAKSGHRVMIRDVETDPAYAAHRDIARNAGYRAVQSTPFFSRNGLLLGMLSTYFKQPRRPDEKYLHTLDLYMLQAARVIEMMCAGSTPKNGPPTAVQASRRSPEAAAVDAKLSLQILETLSFFDGLTTEEKAALLQVARFKHFKRGDMIYRIGDLVTHLHWVCTGLVQKYRETPDGNEMTSAIRIVGDVLFNHEVVHGKRVRTMNAKALQNTTLFSVPVEWIDAHIGTMDNLMHRFMQIMAEDTQASRIETEHQSTMSAAQIVACFLQHLCVKHRFDPRGFTLPYTKSIIASRLGMKLESLSRVLPKLRDYGIIVRGKQVSFTNVTSAQKFSCGYCSVAEECPTGKTMRELTINAPPRKKLEGAD